nr:MAG TPA: hypothetical protein [Caudoviricetes sp.]
MLFIWFYYIQFRTMKLLILNNFITEKEVFI